MPLQKDGLRIEGREVNRRLVGAIQKTLAKSLGFERITSRTVERDSRRFIYFTSEPYLTVPANDEDQRPCLQLLADVPLNCWLVVEVAVRRANAPGNRDGEHFIEHLSIKSHMGETRDSAKLLFRAEWDARESDVGHAQPHWNIHREAWQPENVESPDLASALADTADTFELFGNDEIGQPNMDSEVRRKATAEALMHFALCANWQENLPKHALTLTSPEHAARWLGNCCAYIRTQLLYVNKKLA